MLIALMSDCHDKFAYLQKAIALANEKGCEQLLFAGDLIAPPGVPVLADFSGDVHMVLGNNEGELVGLLTKIGQHAHIHFHKDIFEQEIDGIRVFMNHYPRITELAAKSGEFDLCIYGHQHWYQYDKISDCELLNPGPIGGSWTKPELLHTFVIYDTTTKTHEKIVLDL